MDIIHQSFQTAINSQLDRLLSEEVHELRAMFAYFDGAGSGAVCAKQACRMFGLLGLDVDTEQVKALGNVYWDEFLKIVDSHVPQRQSIDLSASNLTNIIDEETSRPTNTSFTGSTKETHSLQSTLDQWQGEWNTIDSFRRGYITAQELRLFLNSCGIIIMEEDLQRFFELHATQTDENEDRTELLLLEKDYLSFRLEYTNHVERERAREAVMMKRLLKFTSSDIESKEFDDNPSEKY